jgi:hypothetical protein
MHEGGDKWVLILVGKLQMKRTLGGLRRRLESAPVTEVVLRK